MTLEWQGHGERHDVGAEWEELCELTVRAVKLEFSVAGPVQFNCMLRDKAPHCTMQLIPHATRCALNKSGLPIRQCQSALGDSI